jgi:hypothetical protein
MIVFHQQSIMAKKLKRGMDRRKGECATSKKTGKEEQTSVLCKSHCSHASIVAKASSFVTPSRQFHHERWLSMSFDYKYWVWITRKRGTKTWTRHSLQRWNGKQRGDSREREMEHTKVEGEGEGAFEGDFEAP